jgi:predicted nucleotidyltransferase
LRKDRGLGKYVLSETTEGVTIKGVSPIPFTKRPLPMPRAAPPIPDKLKETLRWATGRLREIYGPRLKRLVLFGSWARGDARPDSDVDLLVILEGPAGAYKEAKRSSRVATRAAAYRDTALSFVHMSEEDFSEDRRPLVQSVEEEGIDLLERLSEGPPTLPQFSTLPR